MELDSKRSGRWELAQEYQQKNQLNKKTRLVDIDKKTIFLQHYNNAKELFKFITQINPITETTKILEVGSGPHGVSFFYPKGKRIALDPLACFYKKEFSFIQDGTNALIVQGIGESLPFQNNTFDCVISDNVVDHTANAHKVLSEIKRVLKDDGLFLLTVNLHHWFKKICCDIFNFLFSIKIVPDFPNFRTHTYFFTPKTINQLIKQSGFKIINTNMPGHDVSNKDITILKPFNHTSGIFLCTKLP